MEFTEEETALIYFNTCITIQQYNHLLEEELSEDDRMLANNILNSCNQLEEKIRNYFEDKPLSRPKWNQTLPSK